MSARITIHVNLTNSKSVVEWLEAIENWFGAATLTEEIDPQKFTSALINMFEILTAGDETTKTTAAVTATASVETMKPKHKQNVDRPHISKTRKRLSTLFLLLHNGYESIRLFCFSSSYIVVDQAAQNFSCATWRPICVQPSECRVTFFYGILKFIDTDTSTRWHAVVWILFGGVSTAESHERREGD